MQKQYPFNVLQTIHALTKASGACSPALRQAILAYAQNLASKIPSTTTIPSELVSYVNRVVLSAHQTTDDDIQQLKSSGYSEDQVFEITLCAAMGASLAKMERGLSALTGV